jgi:hypothetical protein
MNPVIPGSPSTERAARRRPFHQTALQQRYFFLTPPLLAEAACSGILTETLFTTQVD